MEKDMGRTQLSFIKAWRLNPLPFNKKDRGDLRLKEQDYDVIIFDNLSDLKFLCAHLKSDPSKYLFVPETAIHDFDKH